MTRRYRLACFTLHPQMRMMGRVERSALIAGGGLREGWSDGLEWMDRLDEVLRGGGHRPDRVRLPASLRLVVSDCRDRRGCVYIDD
ncbi:MULTISPECIES: hypothetical protein [unclassified Actinomadura]|uniref:hypothetical protein n=1 Tax=unclassified Actinomadura TaxID=2626254 RepID=UPI0011EFC3D8|nr:hypothetical protein [Actinomadura sp. K4S16]